MQSYKISELDELKLIYYEILDGYTFHPETSLYIKHLTEKENHFLLVKRQELNGYYQNAGVPTEKELLKNAIENGEWSAEKEEKILEIKYLISDNEKISVNIIQEQRGWIEKQIDDKKKELSEIYAHRKAVLGRSIEDLVDEDINDYLVYICCFKDNGLTEYITEKYDDYLEWDTDSMIKISNALAITYNRFSEEKIKKIACMPFFLNKFCFCKDKMESFLGKAIWELSHYQIHLLSLGVKNLNTLQGAKGSPPEIHLDAKPSDVVFWYETQHGIQQTRQK